MSDRKRLIGLVTAGIARYCVLRQVCKNVDQAQVIADFLLENNVKITDLREGEPSESTENHPAQI